MSGEANDTGASSGRDTASGESLENYQAGDGALSDLHQIIDTNCATALSYTVEAGSGVITLSDLHGSLSNALTSLNVSSGIFIILDLSKHSSTTW